MNYKKLVDYVSTVLDADKRQQMQERDALKKALKKLKRKQKELKDKLVTEKDEYNRQRIQEKIEIARAQRKKGLELLESLIRKKNRKKSE
jgi:pheromone shutdown protein TraB